MTRREREIMRRRDDIIEAAHKLFVSNGFEQVIMSEIARKSEFSRKTLYAYFKSKTDLMVIVVIRMLYRLDETLEKCLSVNGHWRHRFMVYGKLYKRFFLDNPGSFELINYYDVAIHNEPHKLSEDVLTELQRYRVTSKPIVPRLLQGGVKAGEFRADLDIPLAVEFFSKALFGVAHEYIIHPDGGDDNAYLDELRMLLRAFTRPDIIE